MNCKTLIIGITFVIIALVAGGVVVGCANSHKRSVPDYAIAPIFDAVEDSKSVPQRIGTFDRQAIIIAFYSSARQDAYMHNLHERHETALANGDTKQALKLEIEGESLQCYAHEQLFSGTASLNNIRLALLDDLQVIAADLNLDRIEQEGLPAISDATYINVTDALLSHLPTTRKKQTE